MGPEAMRSAHPACWTLSAAAVPGPWARGWPRGTCRKGAWGTWRPCGWHVEGDHAGVTVEVGWRTCGKQVGTGGQWGGSGGQARTTRGPHRGHMQDATWVRTGASGTMLGACGDHTRAYVGARGGKSWWGAPMLGSAEASRGVLGAGISPVHEGAPALRVTHPPQLEPSQLRPQPRRAERCCLHPVGPLSQAVGRRAPVSGARFRS